MGRKPNIGLLLNAYTFCVQHPDQHDQRFYRAQLIDNRVVMCIAGHVITLGLTVPHEWLPSSLKASVRGVNQRWAYIRVGQSRARLAEQMAEEMLGLPFAEAQALWHCPTLADVGQKIEDILRFSPSTQGMAEADAAISRLEALAGA